MWYYFQLATNSVCQEVNDAISGRRLSVMAQDTSERVFQDVRHQTTKGGSNGLSM